jgi:hypothetical protein
MTTTTTTSNNSDIDYSEYIGFFTHSAAVIMAYLELQEDLHDFSHVHGLFLLVASKVCREVHALRGLIVASTETVTSSSTSSSSSSSSSHNFGTLVLQLVLKPIVVILASTWTATILALGALAAALVEVINDTTVGGHHGAIVLAIIDLIELTQEAGIVFLGGALKTIMELRGLKLSLAGLATLFAIIETVDDDAHMGGISTHNGVLILAVFKFIRTMGSKEFFKYVRKKGTKRLLKLVDTPAGVLGKEYYGEESSSSLGGDDDENGEMTPPTKDQSSPNENKKKKK